MCQFECKLFDANELMTWIFYQIDSKIVSCTNYEDDSEFKSYAECVSSHQPKIECKIPWLSAPEDPEACKGKVPVEEQTVDEF